MERRHQPGPGLREFRPGQPTAGQTCSRKVPAVTTSKVPAVSSRKVPAVTTSALPHNATKIQGSCPQRSCEALEISQGWLEALLPSHRWIRWEIATSGNIKYWEGIPGFLREFTIRSQTMYPTWPSEARLLDENFSKKPHNAKKRPKKPNRLFKDQKKATLYLRYCHSFVTKYI